MEAHRKGKESAAAARAAAEAAGEDQAAQEQAAKEAFDREDDRTPEERETFKQVRGLYRRCRTSDESAAAAVAKGSRPTSLAVAGPPCGEFVVWPPADLGRLHVLV